MANNHIDVYKVSAISGTEEFIKRTERLSEAYNTAKEIWDNLTETEKDTHSVEIRYNYRWDGISPEKMIPGCIYPGAWKYDVAKRWTNETC